MTLGRARGRSWRGGGWRKRRRDQRRTLSRCGIPIMEPGWSAPAPYAVCPGGLMDGELLGQHDKVAFNDEMAVMSLAVKRG
jgi:hypothetical protein